MLALLVGGSFVSAQENCANGVDDDGDGLVDLNDTMDCPCMHILEVDSTVTSLIPNPSFELYDALPTEVSQLDHCTDWSQATYASTDYYNTAGYYLPNTPMPVPDGNAYTGFYVMYDNPGNGIGNADPYTEYVGANFTQPLLAGVTYVLRAYIAGGGLTFTFLDTIPDPLDLPVYTFDPPYFGPVDITIFGSAIPATFPVGAIFDCPISVGWVEIGHAAYQAEPHWSVITIPFTPVVDMYGIMIGGPCIPPIDHGFVEHGAWSGTGPYYLLDDLSLNTLDQFIGVIVPSGGLCAQDLSLTAYAPASTLSYQWYRNGIALVGQVDSVLDVSLAMGAGNYTCVAFDNNNDCLAMDHFVAQEAMTLDVTATPRKGCEPLEVQFTCANDLAGMTWHFGDGSSGQGTNIMHTYQQAGTYDVTFEYTALTGCMYTSPLNLPITVLHRPDIDIVADPAGPYSPGQIISLQGVGNHADHWSWSLGSIPPFLDLDTNHTELTMPNAPGVYEIALYASILYNVNVSFTCLDTAYIQLVVPECNANTVFVPSAFSPNANGSNDQLCVYGPYVENMILRIYDRWGNKVFESTDQEACWDGLHNGEPLNSGVFVYHLSATLATGEEVEKQGNITLTR